MLKAFGFGSLLNYVNVVPVSKLKFLLTSVAFLTHKSWQLDFEEDIVFEYVLIDMFGPQYT